MKILFIGEIVGKCGIFCVKNILPKLKERYNFDLIIANGDGATGGFGLGKNHAIYLHKLGIDIITGGECIYYKKDIVEHISQAPYILRPANFPYGNPGRGFTLLQTPQGKIAVISLLGQSGFERIHLASPFFCVKSILDKISSDAKIVIVDFHAATTSEKYSLFYYLAGQVTAVIGSHARAITADAKILAGKTAVLCDAGRTGNSFSPAGLDPEVEIRKYLTQIHSYSQVKCEYLELQGAIVECDADGKATAISILKEACQEAFHDSNRENHPD